MSWYKKITAKFVYNNPLVKYMLHENDEYITLENVVVDSESRNQGLGTDFMNALKEYSNVTNKPLYLTPSADLGGNVNKLTRWYKNLGFKNKPKSDFIMQKMKYEPNGDKNGV
jgi:GNAT superfamily N-acetyltransferase